MWALPALMALALLPTVKNTLSGVCLSFPVAETASIIRVVKTVQSLTIATEWRINMSKKCVCGNEMFTVFMCRKCEHLLYVEEDAHIVVAMANHSMNIGEVSRQLFMHRNTVTYHLDKVKRQTGLDPRRFYDLIELVKLAQEVLENGS